MRCHRAYRVFIGIASSIYIINIDISDTIEELSVNAPAGNRPFRHIVFIKTLFFIKHIPRFRIHNISIVQSA